MAKRNWNLRLALISLTLLALVWRAGGTGGLVYGVIGIETDAKGSITRIDPEGPAAGSVLEVGHRLLTVAPSRLRPAVGEVVVIEAVGDGETVKARIEAAAHPSDEIVKELVDAAVGLIFLSAAIYAFAVVGNRQAAVLWLMAVCLMTFTGRSPDFPPGHLAMFDNLVRVAATFFGTSAFLDFVWSCGRSPSRKALRAIYWPAFTVALLLPGLIFLPERNPWIQWVFVPILPVLFLQAPTYQIVGLVTLVKRRLEVPGLDPLIWLSAAILLASQGYFLAGQLVDPLDHPPWLGTHPYIWLQLALGIVMARWVVRARTRQTASSP